MPLPTGDVIGILADNLRLRESVLPISKRDAIRWTQGLDLPRGGDTVLYTGMMYQLIPYIEGLVKAVKFLGGTPLAKLTFLGRWINRFVNVSAFMARPSRKLKAIYNQVPIDVAALLKQAGVKFGCLYEDDLYSGALAHDLGVDEVVAEHAQRVSEVFKKYGVKTVITIDPHTTNMLRSVYPQLLTDCDVEVKTYLEVLAERSPSVATALTGEVVIHDPCVFARYEEILDEPRGLLRAAGLTLREPEYSGRMTWCCGGPVESLYPEKAAQNAAKRVEQLRAASNEIVTMCPMCLVNLSGVAPEGTDIKDVSEYLRGAFLD